jgi:dihydroorotate dehydrogenase electron transfer subunit
MPVDIEAKVIRNTRLSSDYNVIALAAPEIAATVAPGQFVMVKPGRCNDPLLRRPFSVFEIIR